MNVKAVICSHFRFCQQSFICRWHLQQYLTLNPGSEFNVRIMMQWKFPKKGRSSAAKARQPRSQSCSGRLVVCKIFVLVSLNTKWIYWNRYLKKYIIVIFSLLQRLDVILVLICLLLASSEYHYVFLHYLFIWQVYVSKIQMLSDTVPILTDVIRNKR